jgi:MFS family permease
MRQSEMQASAPVTVQPRQLRAGFSYVWNTPDLLMPLALMACVGTLAYEWLVTLPLLATQTFESGPETFAFMFTCLGAGSVLGGLAVAGTLQATLRSMIYATGVLGLLLTAVSASPTLPFVFVGLFFVGAASVVSKAITTSYLQIHSRPDMRGRVLALLMVTIGGTTAIGGPFVGWIGETYGARVALAQGGLVAIFASLTALTILNKSRHFNSLYVPKKTAPPEGGI